MLGLACASLPPVWAYAAQSEPVAIEQMTWPELDARIKAGATTVIVPTGGTEQNGPAIIMGKHNMIVARTANMIAEQLGNAVVTPVISYVPEGKIAPPEGHMRFPGTISLTDAAFANVLEDTARSLKQHGFTLICFIGDHGGNQAPQAKVAEKLSREWEAEHVRVLQVVDYYANNGQEAWLKEQGVNVQNPSAHAGLMDTAEMMAVEPAGVRKDELKPFSERDFEKTGAKGDGTRATSALGKGLLARKVDAAVKQIRAAQAQVKSQSAEPKKEP